MEFYYDQLRQAYSKIFNYYLNNLSNIKTKLKNEKFTANKEMPLVSHQTEFEFVKSLDNKICELIPNDAQKYNKMLKLLMFVNSENYSTIDSLLKRYYELCDFNLEMLKTLDVHDSNIIGIMPVNSSKDQVVVSDIASQSFRIKFKFEKEEAEALDENEFIENSMLLWQNIIHDDRQPTPNEYLIVHLAYNILKTNSSSNYSLNRNFTGMGTPGFRPYTQT